MLSKPIQASALQLVNGTLAITTATLVQPDFGTALPAGPRAPIVVTAMPVNARFLALFSRRFLMESLHVRGLYAPRTAGEIEIAAQDDRGRTIAWLAWQPLDPGYRLLRRILPEIGIACLVLMVLGLFQLRRIFHFVDLLIQRETDGGRAVDADRLTPEALFRDQVALEIGSLGYGVDSLAIHCVGFDGLDEIEAAIGEGAREVFMRIAAQRLAAACRGDTLVTRISPESFAMLTLGCDSHHAVGLRRRIERLMTSPVALPMGRFASRCAIGSAIVTDPAADTGEMLRAACDAMAEARHAVCA
jgi:GGDEF domain-containing protein